MAPCRHQWRPLARRQTFAAHQSSASTATTCTYEEFTRTTQWFGLSTVEKYKSDSRVIETLRSQGWEVSVDELFVLVCTACYATCRVGAMYICIAVLHCGVCLLYFCRVGGDWLMLDACFLFSLIIFFFVLLRVLQKKKKKKKKKTLNHTHPRSPESPSTCP
jgi:hypothetical protein